MRIFISEFRKLLFYKYALIIFALLLLINGALCFLKTEEANKTLPDADIMTQAYEDYISDRSGFMAYIKEVEAYEIEQRNLAQEAMVRGEEYIWPERNWTYTGKSNNPNIEKNILQSVLSAAENASGYRKTIEQFIAQNKTKLKEYELRGVEKDTYTYLYTEYTIKTYEEFLNKDVRIGFEYVHGWEEFFTYHESGIFAFAAILVLCCSVMLGDKSCGFYAILSVSKKGRGRTLSAKLGLCALSAVVLSTLFTLTSLLIYGTRIGLSSPFNVIQALPTFTYLPFECSVLEYLFILLAVRAAVSLLFALFACAFASVLNNYIYSYLAGVAFVGLNINFYLLEVLNPNGFLKVNNLHSIWSVYPLFNRVRAFEFFTKPLENLILLPILFFLLSFGLVTLIALIYHRMGMVVKIKLPSSLSRLIGKYTPKRKRKQKLHSVRLLPYEMYKLCSSAVILLLVLGTLLGSLYTAGKYYKKEHHYFESIYEEYMDVLAGPSSEETDQYIRAERLRINTVIAQKDFMIQRFQSGEITFSEYSAYQKEYYNADSRREVLLDIENHQRYIRNYESVYGGNLWYLHDIGYEKFFNRSFDILFYLAILLLFCGIFCVEYKSNNKGGSFYAIMQSTKNGRKKSFVSRYLAGLLLYLSLWVFFVGGEYFFLIKEWGLPELSAPLASLHTFENLDSGITVGRYLVLCALMRLLGGALLVMIVSAFSQFTKKPIPTITASLLTTLVPHTLVLLGVNALVNIDFTSLIDIHSLVRLSISRQSDTGDGLNSMLIFTLITALLSAVMTVGAYLSFVKIRIFKKGSEKP